MSYLGVVNILPPSINCKSQPRDRRSQNREQLSHSRDRFVIVLHSFPLPFCRALVATPVPGYGNAAHLIFAH